MSVKNHSEERALRSVDIDRDAADWAPSNEVADTALYVTVPVAFGMAVVLEAIPEARFEGLAASLA